MKVNKILKKKNYTIINDKYIKYSSIDAELINDLINDYSIVFDYSDEKIKDVYNKITDDMDSVFKYYYDLQDKIEEMLYPPESFYYLIINVSKIYHLIDLGRYYIDRWFNSSNKDLRLITNINDDDINNKINICSLLNNLYRTDKINISIIDEIDLDNNEFNCFCGIVSIVPIIDGYNIKEVLDLINYVDNTYNYLLKKYEEEKEKDETYFK